MNLRHRAAARCWCEYISRFGEVENLRYFWRRKIDLQLKYFYWNKFSTFPLEKSIEWLAAAAGFKFGWISTEAGIGQSWTNFCAWIFARPSIYRLTAEETPGLRHEMWYSSHNDSVPGMEGLNFQDTLIPRLVSSSVMSFVPLKCLWFFTSWLHVHSVQRAE